MTNKLMTLAEALATGRPFKNESWADFRDPKSEYGVFTVYVQEINEPVWEIQEEEKPSWRVWTNAKCEILITSEIPTQWNDDLCWVDITESLASALAPYIKKELNL